MENKENKGNPDPEASAGKSTRKKKILTKEEKDAFRDRRIKYYKEQKEKKLAAHGITKESLLDKKRLPKTSLNTRGLSRFVSSGYLMKVEGVYLLNYKPITELTLTEIKQAEVPVALKKILMELIKGDIRLKTTEDRVESLKVVSTTNGVKFVEQVPADNLPAVETVVLPGFETFMQQYGTEIFEAFGRFESPKELYKRFVSEGKIPEKSNITVREIQSIFYQNKDKIRELRMNLSGDYEDLSIGVKRSRLEKLDWLMRIMEWEINENADITKRLKLSAEMRELMAAARKEVEGDTLKIDVNGRIDIEATLNHQSMSDPLFNQLTIAQMVMSRVALRLRVPYESIVHQLCKSYYAKYAGFRKVDLTLLDKPVYPSAINYDILDFTDDFERLKRESAYKEETYEIEETAYETVAVKESFKKQLERLLGEE